MPTYHARGITLRLGATSLSDTVTRDIILKKGERAKQQCEAAMEKLGDSELLDEKRVSFPGDEGGYDLHWVGAAPFMQVQAGRGPLGQRSVGPPRPSGANDDAGTSKAQDGRLPHALVLHVKLSNRTFVSGLDVSNQVHLKIDVLFNGQLSSCRLIPLHDIRSGAQSLHQIFSGHRIDYLAERPYILIPPGMAADSNPRSANGAVTAEERWVQVSLALQREANARGTDERGNAPPSARFLHALAIMQMPEQVRKMQKPGGRKFGVIDVVISAGVGRKVTSGTGYLKAPQRLDDENFAIHVDRHNIAEETAADASGTDYPEQIGDLLDDYASGDALGPEQLGLAPLAVSTHPMFDATPVPSVASLLISTQAKSVPPPSQDTRLSPLSPTRIQPSSRLPSLHKPNDYHSNVSSSPDRGRANFFQGPEDGAAGRYWNSTYRPYSTPQDTQSFMGCILSSTHAPRMHPSPYNFHLSDPGLEHDLPSGLSNTALHGTAALISSPVQPSCNAHSLRTTQQFIRDPEWSIGSSQGPYNPSSHIDPTEPIYGHGQARRGPFGSANALPFVPHIPPNHVLHGMGTGSFMPTMSLPPGPQGPYGLSAYSYSSPFERDYFGPLPPAGLYSVPEKPQYSVYPSKSPRKPLSVKPGLTDANEPQSSILINRLVITGKGGITLIDKQWTSPQRVTVQQEDTPIYQSLNKYSIKNSNKAIGSATRDELPYRQSRSPVKLCTSLPESANGNVVIPTASSIPDKQKRDSAYGGQVAPIHLRIGSATNIPTLEEEYGLATEESGLSVQNLSNASLVVAKPAIPQRRVASRNSVLGVQGPKAATYVLEDPEEVLREAKPLRRSRSPKKLLGSANPILPQHTVSAFADASWNVSERITSSPFSSILSTPELKLKKVVELQEPSQLSPQKLSGPFVQLDGSLKRRAVNSSPRKPQFLPVTSPRKLDILTSSELIESPARQLQHQMLGKPPFSPLPSAKKRKLAKQPRSPDRLKTVDNPPLNRDCVIAFAESKKEESEKSMLRQVKGERQGVFKEEYVVFSCRFFVAGD